VDGGPEYLSLFLPALCQAFETLFYYPRPVVAAVNGHAIAGGCLLACAADHRIMAQQSGRIGVPELLVGVPFPTTALEVLRFAAAPQYMQELIYGGGTYAPDDARVRGLVDVVVEPSQLLEQALAAAERFAALPATAFTLTKQQLREPAMKRIREEGARWDVAIREYWARPETLADMREYVARTFKPSAK
jgi:enoyl-CoA hydratase